MNPESAVSGRTTLSVSKLTFPWAILSLVVTVAIGLLVNHFVEADWIAPVVMGAVMACLFAVGRIPRRGRKRDTT